MAASPLEPETMLNRDLSPMENIFDYPDADIILRSSDVCDFRVHKLFITKSSPVLNAIVQDSSTPVDAGTPLPVVHLPERGAVLYNLLTFILPVSPVLLPTLEETMELLSVAQKYDMVHVLVHIRGSIALQNPPLINKGNAFQAYSLAREYDLRQEMIQAARITLKFTLTIENLEDMLDIIPGDSLDELWRYHQGVRANLVADIDQLRGPDVCSTLKGPSCVQLTSSGIPQWIDDYIVYMAWTPSSFDLIEFQTALAKHVNITRTCSSCAYLSGQTIDEFWTALTTFVHANLEQVESDFPISKGNMPPKGHNGSTTATPSLPECLEVSDADIVVQSSDSANFRVHKSILVSSSQIFRDLFSLPQPANNDMVDGLPMVRLAEDAELIRALITMLYPIPSEIPDSYERVLALLGAVQKYEMSAVQSSIRAEVVRRDMPAPPQAEAFRAYAIAFSNNLLPEMETAARLTLDHPLTFEALEDDLPLFGGSALRSLTNFRRTCRDSVVSCLESFLDFHNGPSKIWVGYFETRTRHSQVDDLDPRGCSSGRSLFYQPPSVFTSAVSVSVLGFPVWLRDFFTEQIGELKENFTRSLINPSSIREKYLAALMKHSLTQKDCTACSMIHVRNGEEYCVELEQKLTRARNQASAALTLTCRAFSVLNVE